MSSAEFDTELAAELVELAVFANQAVTSVFLPNGWQLQYKGAASADYGGSQYFFATKTPDGSSQKVCALVLGARWQDFLSYYYPVLNQPFTSVPGKIVGRSVSEQAQITIGFEQLYAVIRKNLLADLNKVKENVPGFSDTLPLITVGLGPGAPISQLAAIDVRPGKIPVQGEDPLPVSSVSSYVFSTPACGDSDWPTLFQSLVKEGFRVTAAADLFPTSPDDKDGFYDAGENHSLGVYIPGYDSPWFERDGYYYSKRLTSNAVSDMSTQSGSIAGDPKGFKQTLAYAMATLVAVTYQQYQQPGLPPSFNFRPYDAKGYFGPNKTAWAGLFDSSDYLVVACRGSVTWQETMTNICAGSVGAIPWLPKNSEVDYGQYSAPMVALYGSFRDDLRDALKNCGGKPILITGHSDGGCLANLIALDLNLNPPSDSTTLDAIYTFGTLPAGTPSFAQTFDGIFKDKNFQVVRPSDVLPKIEFQFPMYKVGEQVLLEGGGLDVANGSTYHSVASYLNLLNPGS